MWTCSKCRRIFKRRKQPHSCNKVTLNSHFKNKDKAKELFEYLFKQINKQVGKCKRISIPCCIHLFGKYDFLAVLPKLSGLEIRFGSNRKLESPRLKQSVPLSLRSYKNCLDLHNEKEIDKELIRWLNEAYRLKDK